MAKFKRLLHDFTSLAQSKDWVRLLNVEMIMLKENLLQQKLISYLKQLGYPKIIFHEDSLQPKNNYIFAEGTDPWLLVAHTDTVKPTPEELLFTFSSKDANLRYPRYISGVGGLGADDRSGVAMAVRLLHDGHRPHIFFPSGEESGLMGTRTFIKNFDAFLELKINFMFQFDRQGNTDIVNYDDSSKELVNHFTQKHFVFTDMCSFTDIKDLMPFFGVSGVNFSVGYTGQHSANEVLDLQGFYNVYVSFTEMFATLPKDKTFTFTTKKYTYDTISLFDNPYPVDNKILSTSELSKVNQKLRKESDYDIEDDGTLKCSICDVSHPIEENFILDGEPTCDICFNGLTNMNLFLCNDCGSFSSLNFLSDFEFDYKKETLRPCCTECMSDDMVPFGDESEKKDTYNKLMTALTKVSKNEK